MAIQFEIMLNRKWCKNCGICAAYCPRKVLALNEKKVLTVENKAQCSGCRMCEFRCPDMAITVEHREVEKNG